MDKIYWNYIYLKDKTRVDYLIDGEWYSKTIDGCPNWKTIRSIVRNHKLNPDWKDIIEEFNRRLSNG